MRKKLHKNIYTKKTNKISYNFSDNKQNIITRDENNKTNNKPDRTNKINYFPIISTVIISGSIIAGYLFLNNNSFI